MKRTKRNILIIEHEAIVALDIKRHFENHGYNVVSTISSLEVTLENLQNLRNIDLIFLDSDLSDFLYRMPVAERIYRLIKTPLVIFISKTDENIRAKCEKYDTIRIVKKPFNDEELLDAVGDILKDIN